MEKGVRELIEFADHYQALPKDSRKLITIYFDGGHPNASGSNSGIFCGSERSFVHTVVTTEGEVSKKIMFEYSNGDAFGRGLDEIESKYNVYFELGSKLSETLSLDYQSYYKKENKSYLEVKGLVDPKFDLPYL